MSLTISLFKIKLYFRVFFFTFKILISSSNMLHFNSTCWSFFFIFLSLVWKLYFCISITSSYAILIACSSCTIFCIIYHFYSCILFFYFHFLGCYLLNSCFHILACLNNYPHILFNLQLFCCIFTSCFEYSDIC